jgi:hypothetical protein
MAKGRALKQEMMMDKQGFTKTPKDQKPMDDLGYFTKAKALPKRLRGK